MKVIIIGGVAGGATAAARLRRLDETAEIVMFERSSYVSYANCGLPYYIGGVIQGEEKLTLMSPQGFRTRYNVDVRVHTQVERINREKRTVTARDLTTGRVYEEGYDRLVLSPGATAIRPGLPGIDLPGIHTLRTVEDTLVLRDRAAAANTRRALVLGGGFIGLEMAENLMEMGVETYIAVRSHQLFQPLDEDMAHLLHTVFRQKGAHLLFGRHVKGFTLQGEGLCASFENGETLNVDLVILAMGVAPETTLAKEAGLKLGQKGSILVDEHMQTSDPDIYAVGDAVAISQRVTRAKTLISLAGPANKEARIAADNICGIKSVYHGSVASSIIKVFDRTVAVTGINEKTARAQGIDYEKVVLSPANHAGYYPGAKNMVIKLLYEKGSLRMLGSQIVGYEGVDKRSDVIATALQAGMPVTELAELDLAYAPPFGSAKDPVNMAGFMAENIEKGLVRQFHWHDIPALQRTAGVFLLDTRTPAEYARGHVEGFVNLPVDELRQRLLEIPKGMPVYVMCHSGIRSYIACRILTQEGFDCYNFSGGYSFYKGVVLDEMMAAETYPCGMEK